jgi:hypothetical protein
VGGMVFCGQFSWKAYFDFSSRKIRSKLSWLLATKTVAMLDDGDRQWCQCSTAHQRGLLRRFARLWTGFWMLAHCRARDLEHITALIGSIKMLSRGSSSKADLMCKSWFSIQGQWKPSLATNPICTRLNLKFYFICFPLYVPTSSQSA